MSAGTVSTAPGGTRCWVAVALGLVVALLPGCGPAPVPDDPELRECLDDAGVDVGALDNLDELREQLGDPAALDCVEMWLNPQEQRDLLTGVFATEDLAAVLVAWIAEQDAGPEVVARSAGTLAGAAGDAEDHDVTGGLLDENLALAVYEQANGRDESYDVWLADPDAQASVPEAEPLMAASLYLDWLEDHGGDSPEYGLAQEIRQLQELVADARVAAAEGA